MMRDPLDCSEERCFCGGVLMLAPVQLTRQSGEIVVLKGFRCASCGFESIAAQSSHAFFSMDPVPQWALWGDHNALPPWMFTHSNGTVMNVR